eukprot:TRINITY_DN31333_c0_g1_i1.p1 TRINITY_DN31333_c0_g1~~TRINITY_DN31333_c0_g1_i1.p1  ORF type:complete len:282 (-),score=31.63 TRINITY_DN31333_c0_g1_i1:205-1050(-)
MSVYSRCLSRAPLLTKILTGSSLAAAGDIVAQTIERRDAIDLQRLLTFGSVGIWWTGAFQHYWLNFLARHFVGSSPRVVATKVALNQLIVHPFIYFPAFFLWNGKVYGGKSVEEISSKFQAEAPSCILHMWCLWIPANVVQFHYIPVPMQVLYISVVNFVWNTMLSWTYNRVLTTEIEDSLQKRYQVTQMFEGEAEVKYNISDWCKWECGVARFEWEYSGTERAYILQGRALVTPTGKWKSLPPFEVKAGDFVVLPHGMTCVWEVIEAMVKQYDIDFDGTC